MKKSDKITKRLGKAMALFTILPAAALPAVTHAQTRVGQRATIRVGDKVRATNPRMNVNVSPRLSIRVNSVRKAGQVDVQIRTPNLDIKK